MVTRGKQTPGRTETAVKSITSNRNDSATVNTVATYSRLQLILRKIKQKESNSNTLSCCTACGSTVDVGSAPAKLSIRGVTGTQKNNKSEARPVEK